MANDKQMYPVTGEKVETDGVYVNETGYEVTLKRGQEFPADLVMGSTEWRLVGFPSDDKVTSMQSISHPNTPPRLHIDRGDK